MTKSDTKKPHHHHNEQLSGGKLLFSVILNFVITATQIVGGILSNSLALISDALHNLSDGIALLLAYIANKISGKSPDNERTFGYQRAEILAAFVNSLALVGISVYIFIEAVDHLRNPEPINGVIMFSVASVGLIANLITVLLLKRDSGSNLNIKAAYLHLLGDTISSVAVIAGGILIIFYEMYWIDPVITFLIGLYILKETISILKDSFRILMQAKPPQLNIEKIKEKLEIISRISDIHHVHLWSLNEKHNHFECHVHLNEDIKVSDTEAIYEEISLILRKNFDITHVTVQFECGWCRQIDLIHKSPLKIS